MSISDITPAAIVDAVVHGHDTKAKLAAYFGVLPNSHTLATALEGLLAAGELKANPLVARLIPHDLLENLPAEGANDMEEQ